MEPKLLAWLIESGLDEQRSKLYLSSLARGPSRASALAAEAGIGRTAVYDNLRYLEEHGYQEKISEGERVTYQAISPDALKRRFSTQLAQLNELMPEFLKLRSNKSVASAIEVFKGKGSARSMFEDILSAAPKEYCYLSNPVETYKTLTRKYIEEWIRRRVRMKIRARAIRTLRLKDPSDTVFFDENTYLRQIRYLPKKVDLYSTIYIYGSNIGILSSYREERSVIIRSADLATTMQQIFELLWSISEHDEAR